MQFWPIFRCLSTCDNYDDFMIRTLSAVTGTRGGCFCRWYESLEIEESVFDTDFVPTPANPVVYHLHGHTLPESLVLTEDDYLSFLANIARNPKLLPASYPESFGSLHLSFHRLSIG